MEKQVDKKHYEFNNYVGIPRWCSYWHQINEVLRTHADSLLIIGTGDSIVETILSTCVKKVNILDIDPELNPDYLTSVTEIDRVCTDKFDTVLCCQVLEHLPFSLFETAISQLAKVCQKYCIISLPQIRFMFRFALYIMNRGRDYQFVKRRNNVSFSFNGEHYWEIGAKGCSLKDVMSVMEKYFDIEKRFTIKENSYHYFFILKNKLRT